MCLSLSIARTVCRSAQLTRPVCCLWPAPAACLFQPNSPEHESAWDLQNIQVVVERVTSAVAHFSSGPTFPSATLLKHNSDGRTSTEDEKSRSFPTYLNHSLRTPTRPQHVCHRPPLPPSITTPIDAHLQALATTCAVASPNSNATSIRRRGSIIRPPDKREPGHLANSKPTKFSKLCSAQNRSQHEHLQCTKWTANHG